MLGLPLSFSVSIHLSIYLYIYLSIYLYLAISISISIYIYVHIYVYVCVYILTPSLSTLYSGPETHRTSPVSGIPGTHSKAQPCLELRRYPGTYSLTQPSTGQGMHICTPSCVHVYYSTPPPPPPLVKLQALPVRYMFQLVLTEEA